MAARCHGHEPGLLRMRVREFDRPERLRRALRIGGLLFGFAVVSLFIPAWHFVGVPGFLIAAVVAAVRRLRQHALVEALSGDCPACGESRDFPIPSDHRLPATLRCPGCGEFVTVEEAAVAP